MRVNKRCANCGKEMFCSTKRKYCRRRCRQKAYRSRLSKGGRLSQEERIAADLKEIQGTRTDRTPRQTALGITQKKKYQLTLADRMISKVIKDSLGL